MALVAEGGFVTDVLELVSLPYLTLPYLTLGTLRVLGRITDPH